MNKPLRTFIALTSLALAAVALTSCGKSAWLTDFDAAKKSAEKTGRNIMLLFSGDDWDTVSADYKKAVFNDSKFVSAVKDEYVLVNVDFSQTEYAVTDLPEDANAKQKKLAERIEAEYEKKEKLARNCNIGQYPSLYILTQEGYILSYIPCAEESKNVDSFLALIESSKPEIEKNLDAINKVKAASGVSRVFAIDALYEKTDPSYLNPFADLVHEVPALDPQNESGLVGKYLLYGAYFDSYEKFDDSPEAASECFEKIAENPFLNTEQKQNAYYMAAFMLARGGVQDFDKIEFLLQTSYELDTGGEYAWDILEAYNSVKAMHDAAEKELSEFEEN